MRGKVADVDVEWQPANEVEADLAAALAEDAHRRYAEILLGSPLYLPRLPKRNSEQYWELTERVPVDTTHLLAFTSLEAMSLTLGSFAQGHTRTDFESVLRLLPSSEVPLAVNPGLPIGVTAPAGMLIAVSRGEAALTPLAEVQRDIETVADSYVRNVCLAALGARDGDRDGAQDRRPRPVAPVNELETALADAVAARDGDAFVEALLGGEVVIPLTGPPADPDDLDGSSAVWYRAEGEFPVIPAFSSAAVLDHSSSGAWERARVPFLTLLANWPDEHHVLCFNPGTDTELVLFGDVMLTLLAEVAEAIEAGESVRPGE